MGVDPIDFDRCACDDAVPDPIAYTLPDGTVIEIVACAECGGVSEWEIDPPRVPDLPDPADVDVEADDYREIIRGKDETIDRLRSKVNRLQSQPGTAGVGDMDEIIQERIDEIEEQESSGWVDRLLNSPVAMTAFTVLALAFIVGARFVGGGRGKTVVETVIDGQTMMVEAAVMSAVNLLRQTSPLAVVAISLSTIAVVIWYLDLEDIG